jgi:hypothetical protein
VWKGNRRSERVEVHEDGLRWQDGKAARSCHWEDVTAVYRQEERTTYQSVLTLRETSTRVELCDGTEVSFDHSLSAYEHLAAVVLEETHPHVLGRKRRELAAGRAEFGPIAITREGVEYRFGGREPWADLGGYTIENGRFWFTDVGFNSVAGTYDCKDIPNLLVLVHMLDDRFSAH